MTTMFTHPHDYELVRDQQRERLVRAERERAGRRSRGVRRILERHTPRVPPSGLASTR